MALTVQAHSLAVAIRERVTTQMLEGEARDNAALELWLGAIMLANVLGEHDLARYLERLAVFLLATRGYAWLVEFIGADTRPDHTCALCESGEEPGHEH